MKQLLLCFWAYASCHVTCVQRTMNCEPLQASALSFSFWKWGICGDTHPHSRAFSLPVLGSGATTTARSLVQRLPNFPRAHSDSFRSFEIWYHLSWQNVWRIALTRHSLYPQRDVKFLLNSEDDTGHVIAVLIGWPRLEERTPNWLTVSKQDHSSWLQKTAPWLYSS